MCGKWWYVYIKITNTYHRKTRYHRAKDRKTTGKGPNIGHQDDLFLNKKKTFVTNCLLKVHFSVAPWFLFVLVAVVSWGPDNRVSTEIKQSLANETYGLVWIKRIDILKGRGRKFEGEWALHADRQRQALLQRRVRLRALVFVLVIVPHLHTSLLRLLQSSKYTEI